MKKRLFVINPKTWNRASSAKKSAIEYFFKSRDGEFHTLETQSRIETLHRVREAVKDGVPQIIPLGGDGTLNAVVNGFFEDGKVIASPTVIGVAEMGTGNDFARYLSKRLTLGRDWKEVCVGGIPTPVDVGCIQFLPGAESAPSEAQYFINAASLGMSGVIVQNKIELPRWVPSQLAYLIPTFQQISKFPAFETELEVDGQTWSRSLLTLFMSKGEFAGGGMKWGGAVGLHDERLDVTLVQPAPLTQLLKSFPKLYTGTFGPEDPVQKIKAKTLTIRTSRAVPVEFDGEAMGTTPISVSIVPSAVKVTL